MDLTELMSQRPKVHASISFGKIAIITEYVHSDAASSIPGSSFVGKGEDYWTIPLTWTSAVCLVNTFGKDLEATGDLLDWMHHEWETKIEPCFRLRTGQGEEIVTDELLRDIAEMCPPNRSPIDPVERRYQVSGALLLATAQRFLLLDEQGTGKMTETALALKLYPDTLPALIVAPASTIYTWQRELAAFGLESVLLDGTAPQRRKEISKIEDDDGPQIAICSYGMLAKHSRVSGYGNIKLSDDHRTPKELNHIPWQTTVADEVHRAKSPKSVQTRALWAVSSRSKYRWGLTGTPIEKSPLDFWALLHFIDPEGWPSKVKMQDRWVHYDTNWFGGIDVHGIREDRTDEWRQVTEYLWRRKMMEGLPPVESETRYCVLKGKHLKAYKDMEKQLMAEVGDDEDVLFAENHMVKTGRLLQLANSFLEISTELDDDGEEITIVTPIEPSPKLDLMMDTLEDYEGTPLLLWFAHVKFMRMAQARMDAKGIDYVVLDGSMNAKRKDAAVQAFQNGDVDIILLSVAAASEGITLTRAPVSIRVERPHSLIMNDQKDRRNLRIGSEIHDLIQEIELVTMNSQEEKQITDQIEKRRIRDEVISPLSVS